MERLRIRENMHIALWLVKDLCWVLDLKSAGTIMIAPTLLMAAWIAWSFRDDANEFLHALAVVSWISANSIWMIGEFYFNDGARPVALLFFIIGIALVAWYYLVRRPFWRSDAGTGS